MAVTTTKTNKPLNPRGNDQSPLAFNRAKLYSGKALDFDGVNDYLTFDGFAGTLSNNDAWTVCGYFKTANVNRGTWFSAHNSSGGNIFRIGTESGNALGLFYADNYQFDTQIGDFDFRDDKMHFVVLSRAQGANGSLATLYVDGVESATQATGPNWDSATQFSLGQEYDGGSTSDFFDGQIAGFKIFNTALTAAQVADLYNNPEKIVPTGVSNDALKLWLPMQEGAGTTAINGADPLGDDIVTNGDFSNGITGWTLGNCWSISSEKMVSDGTSNAWSFQNNLFTSGKKYKVEFEVSGYSSGSLNVKAGDTSGSDDLTNITANGTYVFETEADGVYLLFKPTTFVGAIDNVTAKEINVADINGATWVHGVGAPVAQTAVIDWNKNTIDKTNEVLIPQGLTAGRDLLGNLFENVRKQGALNLDGNSWAEVHDNASLDITDAITLEAWVYWDTSFSTAKGLFGKWTSGSDCYLLYISDTTTIRFYINSSISTYGSLTNGWHHIVGTYDKTNRKLYVDGTLQDTDAMTADINTSALPVEIGRHTYSASKCVDNSIAQPRIYNRALTAEEVERNYNAGKNIYK